MKISVLGGFILLSSLSYSQSNFHSISIPSVGSINDIITDGNESVYVATIDGIWWFNLFSNPSGKIYDGVDGLSNLPVYDLSVDLQGSIYASASAKSFYTLNTQSNTWGSVQVQSTQAFSHFTYVFTSANSVRYFGTENGLVFTQSSGSNNLVEKTQYTSALNLGSITSISQTSNQSTTAVLSTNGIILDIQGFILPVTSASLLPSDSVISGLMYRDVSYDGTNAGLYVADFSNGAPPSVNTFNTGNSGVPSNRIQALTAYGDSLFLGTDQGLAIYDLSSQTWMTLDKSNSNLPSNDVTHLAISSSGRLWIATADNNLSTWSAGLGLEEQNSEEPFYRLEGKDLYMDQDKVQGDLQIFSLSGQEVFSGKISEQISLEKLSSGIYFITVAEENGRYVLHDRIYLP